MFQCTITNALLPRLLRAWALFLPACLHTLKDLLNGACDRMTGSSLKIFLFHRDSFGCGFAKIFRHMFICLKIFTSPRSKLSWFITKIFRKKPLLTINNRWASLENKKARDNAGQNRSHNGSYLVPPRVFLVPILICNNQAIIYKRKAMSTPTPTSSLLHSVAPVLSINTLYFTW